MAFDVSNISKFTDQVSQELVKKSVLSGRTLEYVTIIPGVKYSTALNILDNTPVIANASCGFGSPTGSVVFKQRNILVSALEVKETLCEKTLEQYWMGKMMKPGSTKDVEFGPILAESYVEKIKLANEFEIWQGILGSTQSTYTKLDGFLVHATTTNGSIGATLSAAPHTSANIIAHVDAMVAAVPEAILDREDLILFMSYGLYNLYTAALRTANLFHYNGENGSDYITFIPGTSIKVVATKGLNGSTKMLLTYGANLVVGTDLLNEEEKFDIFYSRDNDEVRVNIQWKIGTQIYFPEYVVVNY